MRTWWAKLTGLVIMVSLLLPEIVLAAGPKAAPLVMVADTRKFTGWEAWWTNLYNESHLYFALLTVVLIPVIGLIFGLLADLVMRTIGIDLAHRDLAEH
ncbi:MAG: DVU0150 family protein [Desulfobaccales bacterium]